MNQNRTLHLLLLGLVCLFAFFLYNDTFFVNIMEARNFVTAREMIEKGNWLVPTMNGELRLAKPPFPTWVTAVFGSIWGMDNIAMLRFPAGLMASLMVFFTYFLAEKLSRNNVFSFVSALVLASSFYVVYMGRTGTWDIYCHSFMVGAILLLVKGWKGKGQNWGTFLGAGFLLGLSFLSKGPVAFFAMLLPFLISYLIVYERKGVLDKWKPLVAALSVFIVISFWWPVYIYLSHAQEAAAVAKTESGSWINRNVRPFWYYWNFPVQTGIWSMFLFTAIFFPYGMRRFREQKLYRFSLYWTLLAVLLLSLFPEKKVRYLLPVLIPSALLTACYLQHLIVVFREKRVDRWDRFLFNINFWIPALVIFALPVGLYVLFVKPGVMGMGSFVLTSVMIIGVFILLIWMYRKKKVEGIIGVLVLMMVLVEALIMPYTNELYNRNPDFKNIRLVREMEQLKEMNLYSAGKEEFRVELVWEVGREVKSWDVEKELVLPEKKAFALFSTEKAQDILSEETLNRVEIQNLDSFDYNRYEKGHRRWKKHFRKYLSIVKPKS